MAPVPKVVVYGASGYTGKLIATSLVAERIPFVAAGRSRESVERAIASVASAAAADIRIAAVEHDVSALRALFKGAAIVINVVGPFWQLGRPVVEAALAEGCHYLDTAGEPDWVAMLRVEFGQRFADRQRVLCPACAWMWAGGQLAAELCLEVPGIDSLDLLYAPNGAATVASTLSFLRMVTKPQLRLVNGKLEAWPALSKIPVAAPHTHEVLTGLPWGGGCEPLWYADHARVRNCRVVVAFPATVSVDWIVSCMEKYQEAARTSSADELEALTNQWGMSIAKTPEPEVLEVNRCVVSCKARGTALSHDVTLYATSPYRQTASMQAEAARQLLASSHRACGFVSPAHAFGARELIAALVEDGLHCHVA